jgi:hypothetical protein
MINQLILDSFCEPVFIIQNNHLENPGSSNSNILKYSATSLYELFIRYDMKKFICNPNALELIKIQDEISLKELETIHIANIRDTEFPEDIKMINNRNFDLFINLGSGLHHNKLLKIPKYGVWFLQLGDVKKYQGKPEGFWEVINNSDETGTSLQIVLGERRNIYTAYQSFSLTDKDSVHRNLNRCYWKALSFIPDKIKALHNYGDEYFFNEIVEKSNYQWTYTNRNYKIPSNSEMFWIIFKILIRKMSRKLFYYFYFYQWSLLYSIENSSGMKKPFYSYNKIIPPKDRFWADPHIIKKGDKYYIYFEEFIYKQKKGFISCIEMDSKGNYSKPIKVLEKDYHMSYPFIIEDDGEVYMIPETKSNKTIEIYKCTEFPYKWEFVTNLMEDIAAVDATILYTDGKYWLFANVVRNEGASSFDELFLFSSDKLVSKNWISHPQNPILSDVKKSRPAGQIIRSNNNFFRPSQNCSKYYGFGMKINQILTLTADSYKETEVESIFPDWGNNIIATHTLNSVDNLTFIDGLLKRRKF